MEFGQALRKDGTKFECTFVSLYKNIKKLNTK